MEYSFDRGTGEVGYFFEVNLIGEIVRRVSGNSQLEKLYGVRSLKEPEPLKKTKKSAAAFLEEPAQGSKVITFDEFMTKSQQKLPPSVLLRKLPMKKAE